MSRLFAFVAALLVLLAGASTSLAQDATPAAATFPDTLGLPVLEISSTAEGFEGLPDETEAGRYHIDFTGESPESIVTFVQLPEGVAADELVGSDVAASPEAEEGAPPAIPDWLYDTYIAGGASGVGGQAIVDLRPGEYAVWNEDFEAPVAVPMTVTGEMPTDLPEPAAGITIREFKTDDGYDFEFVGDLVAGAATLQVSNEADQPHHVVFIKSPREITEEQVMQLLMFDPAAGGTPPPGMPNPEELTFPLYVPVQSPDSTQWHALNLEPGYYAVACFVEDPTKENIPHAFEGMIEVFEVAGA
jgi:hypothetical protein